MAARWPLARPMRMPLQLGRSALVEAAVIGTLSLTATTLGVLLVITTWFGGWALLGVAIVAAGGYLSVLGLTAVVSSRASDVVLSADGLRIEGGPHHGRALRWDELDPAQCAVEAPPEGKVQGHRLRAGDVLLAEVWQSDDLPALRVLVEDIRAVHGVVEADVADAAPPPAVDVTQLRCEACHAVIAPIDDARTTCRHCDAGVVVPEPIRALVRAAGKVTEQEARVGVLLDQPGAGRANLTIALCAVPAIAAPIVALAGTLWLRAHHAAGIGLGFAAWGGAIALGFAITCLGWLPITRRAALRSFLFELGARRDGATFRCRTCSGGLPEPAGPHELLVRCVYCGSDHLLGVDPRPWQQHAHHRERSIAQVLDERRASLSASRWALAIFGVAGAAAWAWWIARVAASG